MLLCVPFRDGGHAAGYPPDELFTVENFDHGRLSKGFRGSWEAGMDGGRRCGSAVLLSDRIQGARTEGTSSAGPVMVEMTNVGIGSRVQKNWRFLDEHF